MELDERNNGIVISSMEDAHELIFKRLLEYRDNAGIKFVPRKKNNNSRLDKGYWFIGNENYLLVSFWKGSDTLEKVHAISFGFSIGSGESWVEMSSKDDVIRAEYLEELTKQLGGFQRLGKRAKWSRRIAGKDVIESIDVFLNDYYPAIDSAVSAYEGLGLGQISDEEDKDYIERIQKFRLANNRIARLCWNNNMWQSPSGPEGKSSNKDTYENRNGYGFEEWLFDTTPLIEGYHYGYIRAAGKQAYQGDVFDVGLYAKNSLDGKKYWLGEISKLEVISVEQREYAYEVYKEKGWFDEMNLDLDSIYATGRDDFLDAKNIFNVRYKPEYLNLLDEPDANRAELAGINGQRYSVFLRANIELGELAGTKNHFEFKPGHKTKGEKASSVKASKSRKMRKRHNMIQSKSYEQLIDLYGKENVGTEQTMSNGLFVDLVVREKDDNYKFYEIKTDATARLNIRQAVGQLLEYSFWNSNINVREMIIVAPAKPTLNDEQYLEKLRRTLSLDIYYQFFDFQKGVLSDKKY